VLKKLIFVISSLLLTTASLYASVDLPSIGSSSSKALSLVEEQMVGDDYMRQLRAIAPIVNDAEINDYIQHLGFKLVEHNTYAENRQFSFFVIRQNTINAFALPGGYIGIHTGLMTQTETESELASVLGHEIAHVTQRHLARRIELQNQLTLPSLAAFAAAIIVASQAKSGETGMGALMSAQGLAQQAIINHTRSNEAEADRVGITTLYDAGFDPNGAVGFFEKMQQNQRYQSNAFEFLRTHPLSRSRITDARLRASKFPNRRIVDRPIYSLMKQKIIALTEQITPVTISKKETEFKQGSITTHAELYGYAIFMMRAKKYDIAEKILNNLQFSDRHQASYAIALAKLNIARETPEQSIPTIEKLLLQSPGNQALVESLAELYISDSQYANARELLLTNIHMTEFAPYLLKLLSEAQDGAGFKAEVYETEGNYLLAMGDLIGARTQFDQALNLHTEDPYARARINAQISRIKEFLRQRSLRH
jgi:beta-barrel assembly-enhancing protease